MKKLLIKKIQITTLLFILFFPCFMTGCIFQTQPPPEINTFHETINPPENGWTNETIEKVLYINGNQISFPFTLKELGSGFSYNEESLRVSPSIKGVFPVPLINYGTTIIGGTFDIPENQLEDAEIKCLIYSYKNDEPLLFINGITIGSSYSELLDAFGEKDVYRLDSGDFVFKTDYDEYSFLIQGKETIDRIMITWKEM